MNTSLENDILNIYGQILDKKRKRFPYGTWQKPEAFKGASDCIKHLIEGVLQWSSDEVRENLSIYTFKENYLYGMVQVLCGASPYYAINLAYPDKFMPWEFKSVPLNYWNGETAKKAIKWLIEDKLRWDDRQIRKGLTKELFAENNLDSMLRTVCKDSVQFALNLTYPGKFKKNEPTHPQCKWSEKNAKRATRWLIEKELKWNDTDIRNKIGSDTFEKNYLSGMLLSVYNNNVFDAIDAAYPDIFAESDFVRLKSRNARSSVRF